MLLTDYLRSTRDPSWDIARQCGVRHAVIRLPEDGAFDYTSLSHWQSVCERYTSYGFTPTVLEPMPNELHDHIKCGDALRDASIEKVIAMLPHMRAVGIRTLCFNWMAHVGWCRTSHSFPERGGAKVTEFNLADYTPTEDKISEETLWENYRYFLDAVMPHAEQCGIRMALHPDDPPLPRLGGVSRIMTSIENISRAICDIRPSEYLGITMCQANFLLMDRDIERTVERFADKIFFIHFRNVVGNAEHVRETFHDNGDIDMAKMMAVYAKHGIDVPVRVDHVPTLAGEISEHPGYDALGRLFAIGYLKGILDAICRKESIL